ncbi:hypothetical protein AB833_16045 [Chromatiales bacterium (ex Bugula neritina AB1)]|nr:hypothetical protein AB833_16045 [Chromatiales bacterium (ex Bugula neritina AB1)]
MIHVLGSINIDYSCKVKSLPSPGETISGRQLNLTPGGKGANQALAARRAGAEVAMTGAVGQDQVADQSLTLLHEAGVNLKSVDRVDGPTGCAFVFVDAQSENQIVIIPGANAAISQRHGENISITEGDFLLLQLEVPVTAVEAAAVNAKSHGAIVIANLAPYQILPETFFQSVDILLLNETEAAQLAADLKIEQKTDIALAIANRLSTSVVLTLGSEGAILVDSELKKSRFSGMNISAIDTVGAGDTFAGYLSAMLADGKSLAMACEIANRAAALACTKPGAQTAIPQIDEVENLLS